MKTGRIATLVVAFTVALVPAQAQAASKTERQVKTLKREAKALKRQVATLKKSRAAWKSQATTRGSQVTTLTTTLASRDSTLLARDQQVASLNGTVSQRDETLRSKDGTIASQAAEVERVNGALQNGLAGQVAEVARGGKITQLHSLVFEPIRTNWLCGATMFQGQSFWSIDVDLENSTLIGDDYVTTSCKG